MSFFDWVLYIFIAICALLIMIMVHEFGHYTAGKLLKFKINEFSIGFGKAIFQKKKKDGEIFSLRIFPLGGYCAFEGEDEDKPDNPGAFNSQKPWKRLIVLFMGAFFNFLSALIFAAILLMSFGYADKVQIRSVELPAGVESSEWLQEGDIVLAVDGVYTNLVYDQYFTNMVAVYDAGIKSSETGDIENSFTVRVKRNGEEMDIVVYKGVYDEIAHIGDEEYGKLYSLDGLDYTYAVSVDGQSVLKVVDGEVEETFEVLNGNVVINDRTYSITGDVDSGFSLNGALLGVTTSNYRYGFFEALGQTFVFCGQWVWKILIILWQLITFQLDLSALGGTVTTVVVMAEATAANIANLLLLFPLISINLAVFNLLPFPALDGARMVFVGIEWIRGKPINRKVEGMIHFIGLMVLLAFVILVDILHFVT